MTASRTVFFDVDSRERFGDAAGAAWRRTGEVIRPNAERLLALAKKRNLPVVVTCCCNPACVPVAGPLPPDMIALAPEAQPNLAALVRSHRAFLLEKPRRHPGQDAACVFRTFDLNANAAPLLDVLAPEECIVFGRSAHCCTPYTVRWLLARQQRVTVISDAVVTREGSIAAAQPFLDALVREGARLETTADCLARLLV